MARSLLPLPQAKLIPLSILSLITTSASLESSIWKVIKSTIDSNQQIGNRSGFE